MDALVSMIEKGIQGQFEESLTIWLTVNTDNEFKHYRKWQWFSELERF